MTAERSDSKRIRDKKLGDEAELMFMNELSNMGAYSHTTGMIPFDYRLCPRIQKPAVYNDDGDQDIPRFVAPDISFWWDEYPVVSFAQVKIKKINYASGRKEPFFYLDEDQLYKMRKAERSGINTFLVIQCGNLNELDVSPQLIYVDINDLREDRTYLEKTRIFDKPVYKIPLSAFKPIIELKDQIINGNQPLQNDIGGYRTQSYSRDSVPARWC